MGRKRPVKPSWFKLFGNLLPVFEAAPDDAVGRAVKGALRYFDTGEVPELELMELILFSAMRPRIEEAYEDFYQKVEAGRRGGMAAAQAKCSTAVPCRAEPTEAEEEEEGEEEEEADAEEEGIEGEGDAGAMAPPYAPDDSFRDAYSYFLSRIPKNIGQ